MRDLSFLIVAENAPELWTLKVLLRAFGVRQIEECYDSARAFDAFKAATPEIVLLGDRLSPSRGWEFVRRLRDFNNSPDPFVPIILATAYDGDRLGWARDAGVSETVKRPVTATDLYRAIDTIVNRPRPFIRIQNYFGPCRRREEGVFSRQDRRRASASRAIGGMAPFSPFPHALALAKTNLIAAE